MASSLATPSTSNSQRHHRNQFKLNVACRYFRIGAGCKYGNNCKFLHDTTTNNSNNNGENNLPSSSSSSSTSSARSLNIKDPNKWVLAPEFVPNQFLNNNTIISTNSTTEPPSNNTHQRSYAEVVNSGKDEDNSGTDIDILTAKEAVLCPYLMKSGFCRYESCSYDHGELCELCDKFCLDPFNEEQRKQHHAECVAQHERQMEIAFAVQQSKEKTCGICFEIVWEKEGRETRFGILPNCNHCFCLECIRRWRQAKQFENKIIRSCPECRICSDFVCPSSFWVDSAKEKEELISNYKKALAGKDCKYFKKGSGRCPFGNKCFYKHALPSGEIIDVGEPPRPERRFNSMGAIERLQNLFFWDFLEERVQIIGDDVYLSDSDDSIISEFLDYF